MAQETQQEKRIDPLTLPIPENLPILPLHGFVFFPAWDFPCRWRAIPPNSSLTRPCWQAG